MIENLCGASVPSPFHEFWASRSVANAWGQDGRTTVPLDLTTGADEAATIGASAAFADISARTILEMSGSGIAAFLGALSGAREDLFAPGKAVGIVWCDANGFARGSGRVAMRSATEAVLISAVSDERWLSAAASAFDVRLVRKPMAGVRFAGPKAGSVLAGVIEGSGCTLRLPGLGEVLALQPSHSSWDLWVEPDSAMALAWSLEAAGARAVGATALKASNLAAGLLTPGIDWTPAQWALSGTAMRTRAQLTQGDYVLGGSSTVPRTVDRAAIYWPAQGQWLTVLWLPSQAGRGAAAPNGWTVLDRMATD